MGKATAGEKVISDLKKRGVELYLDGGKVAFHTLRPGVVATQKEIERVGANRAEVISILRRKTLRSVPSPARPAKSSPPTPSAPLIGSRVISAAEILADPHWHISAVETVDIVELTPELAAHWIDRDEARAAEDRINSDNRHVNQRRVNEFMHVMSEDKWFLTNQGFGFVTTGRMADGQHRAWAGFDSGKTIRVVVLRGMNPEAVKHIDCGQKRSTSERLRREKIPHHKHASIWSALHHELMHGPGAIPIQYAMDWSTSYLADLEWGVRSMPSGTDPLRKTLRSSAIWGALVFARPTNPQKVEEFAALVADPKPPRGDHPAAALISYLKNNPIYGGYVFRRELASRTLNAVQAFILGRRLELLRTSEPAIDYFSKAHAGRIGG